MNETYAVVTQAGVDTLSQANKDALIAACTQTSWDTCRHSVTAPDELVLKWNGAGNPCNDVSLANTVYPYNEMLVLMATPHWTSQEL